MTRRPKHRKSISLAPQPKVQLDRIAARLGRSRASLLEEWIAAAGELHGVPRPALDEAKVVVRKVPRIVPQHRVF